MLQLCGVVVIASLLVHGASLVVLTRRTGRAAAAVEAAPAAVAPVAAPAEPAADPPRPAGWVTEAELDAAPSAGSITIDELRRLQASGEPVVIGDARKARGADDLAAVGSVRIDPERAVLAARQLAIPKSSTIALYCA